LTLGLGSFSEIRYADGKRDLRKKVQPASFYETSARLYTLMVIVKYTEPPPHN